MSCDVSNPAGTSVDDSSVKAELRSTFEAGPIKVAALKVAVPQIMFQTHSMNNQTDTNLADLGASG